MIKIRNAFLDDINQLKIIKPSLNNDLIIRRLNRQKKGLLEYLVLCNDEEIVGFVVLNWNGKNTHPEYPDIEDLYTKESKRNNGFATKLIYECEKLAKKKGFHKIGLAVNPVNNKNVYYFYQQLGYLHDGTKSYIDGIYNEVEDWVIDLEKVI